jgi:hypothetical protein
MENAYALLNYRFPEMSNFSERAMLIKSAFNAFVAIQAAFVDTSREELRAIAISLYSGIDFDFAYLAVCQTITVRRTTERRVFQR